MGDAPGTASDRRTPRGRGGRPARRRGRARARHRGAHAVRVLRGQLGTAPPRGDGAHAAPARLPARGDRALRGERAPRERHRTARSPRAVDRAGDPARRARDARRPAAPSPHRPRLLRARGDRARRARLGAGRVSRPRAPRPDGRAVGGRWSGRPRRRSAGPHRRRAAPVRLPPLGVRVRRAPFHRPHVARLRGGRPGRSARGVPAARAPFRAPVRPAPPAGAHGTASALDPRMARVLPPEPRRAPADPLGGKRRARRGRATGDRALRPGVPARRAVRGPPPHALRPPACGRDRRPGLRRDDPSLHRRGAAARARPRPVPGAQCDPHAQEAVASSPRPTRAR